MHASGTVGFVVRLDPAAELRRYPAAMLRRLALSALLLIPAPLAGAAEMQLAYRDPAHPEVGTLSIAIVGPIEEGDATRLLGLLTKATADGRIVRSVSLNSPGGSVWEGMRLGALIRERGLVATVYADGMCASACFLAFAAGQGKIVNQRARIGVHGASVNGQETPEAAAATIAMAREVTRLGVPPAIVGRMTVTPGTDMVWLSREDLASMEGPFGRVLVRP